MSNIDDRPVGIKSSTSIPEFVQGEQNIANSINDILENRLVHKLWSVRSKAFDELLQIIQSQNPSPILQETNKWPKYLADPNPAVLEKVILALQAYISHRKQYSPDEIRELIVPIIEKGITSSKNTVKMISINCILEISDASKEFNEILDCCTILTSKTIKIQIASAQCLTALIAKFGTKEINIKPLLHTFEILANSPNPTVRQEVLLFYKAIYKWMGNSILPLISNLKPVQQDELIKMFSLDEAVKLENNSKEAHQNIAEHDHSNEIDVATSLDIDISEFQNPSDCLPKFNQ